MSKPLPRSVVMTTPAVVAPGDVPRFVTILSLGMAAPIVVMTIMLVPVAPVPVVAVMPVAIVNSVVPAADVPPLQAVDFVELPPREVMVVAQRRAVVPEAEPPVVPEPPWHIPVAVVDHVVVPRRMMAIVGPIVCRCGLCSAQAKAAYEGERAD